MGDPTKPAKAPFHIPSLDGLRAISWGIVFVGHAWEGSHFPGGFGVTVFFFLSGYLITTLMRMEFEKSGTVSFKDFYIRRALRILPPFYLVLGAGVVLALFGYLRPPPDLALAVTAQGFHMANYWMITHPGHFMDGTGVYWSLAIEEHFYLVFPALYLFLMKRVSLRKHLPAILLGLCGAVLAWRIFCTVVLHRSDESVYVSTDTRIDAIIWGCILAVHRNPMLDKDHVGATPIWRYVLFPMGVVLILVCLLLGNEHHGNIFFRQTIRYTLIDLGLYPIFAVAIARPDFLPMRPLQWAPLRFVGTLSYSLYLVHHVIIYMVGGPAENARAAVRIGGLALVLSFAISYAIYRFVEQPAANLRRRLTAKKKKPT
jgi:peptidoglycan/LPS O-acetylase OafA/YrhL